MNKLKFAILIICMLTACATIPDYYPIIDPVSITDSAKHTTDMNECRTITNTVDYSNAETIAAIRGGAIGGAAVVGGTVAVLGATGGLSAIAAGTAVVAPIVWPLIGVGMLIGANANENKTKQEEQELRAIVWNRCLTERGYVVLSQR